MKTVYTTTYPTELYALKGRLEAEGIPCSIANENIISVQPFYSNAVGGALLQVNDSDFDQAVTIIEAITTNQAAYNTNASYEKTLEELHLKNFLRKKPLHLESKTVPEEFKFKYLSPEEIQSIINIEATYHEKTPQKKFSIKGLLDALYGGGFSHFFRQKKTTFYLEQDLITASMSAEEKDQQTCPSCHSHNIGYGYSAPTRMAIVPLILSCFVGYVFPKFEKRYHCFDCHKEFKNL